MQLLWVACVVWRRVCLCCVEACLLVLCGGVSACVVWRRVCLCCVEACLLVLCGGVSACVEHEVYHIVWGPLHNLMVWV